MPFHCCRDYCPLFIRSSSAPYKRDCVSSWPAVCISMYSFILLFIRLHYVTGHKMNECTVYLSDPLIGCSRQKKQLTRKHVLINPYLVLWKVQRMFGKTESEWEREKEQDTIDLSFPSASSDGWPKSLSYFHYRSRSERRAATRFSIDTLTREYDGEKKENAYMHIRIRHKPAMLLRPCTSTSLCESWCAIENSC